MLIGRHLAVVLVGYPSLLLFSSSAGQHQRYKHTLAVALDFTASATTNGPLSRPPVAALAIALGLLPRAAAKPTSASSRAGPCTTPLPSLTHTLTPDRIPQSSPDPAAAPASYSGALPRAGPPPPIGTPSSFLLLPPSLVIVIRK